MLITIRSGWLLELLTELKTQIDTCPSKTSFKLLLCQLPWSAIEQIVDALHVTTMVAGDEYKETAD